MGIKKIVISVILSAIMAQTANAGFFVDREPKPAVVVEVPPVVAAPIAKQGTLLHVGNQDPSPAFVTLGRENVPLRDALRYLLPDGWHAFAVRGINIKQSVGYAGQMSWVDALSGMAAKYRLKITLDWVRHDAQVSLPDVEALESGLLDDVQLAAKQADDRKVEKARKVEEARLMKEQKLEAARLKREDAARAKKENEAVRLAKKSKALADAKALEQARVDAAELAKFEADMKKASEEAQARADADAKALADAKAVEQARADADELAKFEADMKKASEEAETKTVQSVSEAMPAATNMESAAIDPTDCLMPDGSSLLGAPAGSLLPKCEMESK